MILLRTRRATPWGRWRRDAPSGYDSEDMKRYGFLAIACVMAAQAQPPAGRGRGAPPPQLTSEQKSQYQGKIAELDAMVKGLRAAHANEDLIADVDIYAKAGKWLMEFPQGFGNAAAIVNYLAVLDQGLERGRLLQKGQSPWVLEKGRKVLGYYSALDGSVQPMGVTIPESYDPAKPDRLYVWLHGRNNGLTEAGFINGFHNAPRFPNTAYTADVGQLTLDCYGRGNNANHQAGEVDIFEGIAAMERRFKVDPDRADPARLLAGRRGRMAHRAAISRSLGRRGGGRGNLPRPPDVRRQPLSALPGWPAAHLRKHHRLGAERVQSSAGRSRWRRR